MVKYTGKDMRIFFGTVDISGQGRSLEIEQEANEIDATTYGSSDNEYIVGKTDRSASLEVLDDSASTAIRNALTVGTTNSMTWFPQGTASGLPKHTAGTVVVRSNNMSYPHDDVVTMGVDLRISGRPTEGTAP